MKRAVVIGGGGVAGIAWVTGLVAGWARQGLSLSEADVFVGTSAGSVVCAQLASGASPEALLDEQLAPSRTQEQAKPYSQAEVDTRNQALFSKVGGDLTAARRRIGAFALRSETVSLDVRRNIVAARLPTTHWPERDLRVVAVDVHSGEHHAFQRTDGVDFIDAIAASCAVPGTWPAVPIAGKLWMDGGIRSLVNADLARDVDIAVVIAPLGYAAGNPISGHLHAEVAQLRAHGTRVVVIVPDEQSLEAMSDNVLDPGRCEPSARAGLVQAAAFRMDVHSIWT